MDVNLGFDTAHFVRLFTFKELRDYTELFCCDLYDKCPYFQAVMHAKYRDC